MHSSVRRNVYIGKSIPLYASTEGLQVARAPKFRSFTIAISQRITDDQTFISRRSAKSIGVPNAPQWAETTWRLMSYARRVVNEQPTWSQLRTESTQYWPGTSTCHADCTVNWHENFLSYCNGWGGYNSQFICEAWVCCFSQRMSKWIDFCKQENPRTNSRWLLYMRTCPSRPHHGFVQTKTSPYMFIIHNIAFSNVWLSTHGSYHERFSMRCAQLVSSWKLHKSPSEVATCRASISILWIDIQWQID